MALGSLVDKPLMQNPLAGGGQLGGALEAPAPTYDELQGDDLVKSISMRMMQQDVKSPAFNAFASEVMKTKGYPTKTMQEYNTLFPNNLLTQNPLAVGDQQLGPLDLSKINKNPYNTEFIGIGADQTNLFGYRVPDEVIAEQKERMKNNPINMYNMTPPSELDLILSDPQGGDQLNDTVNYGGSDVGPNVGNEIAVPSTPNPIQGIGLDGKPIEPGLQDLVSPATPPTPTIPKLDGTVGFPVTVSGDDSIASTATVNPYQEQFTGFGNQLTGFGDQLTGLGDQFGGLDKQFNTINTRLDNVDEGIASLSEQLQPQQQQLYNSPYSNFNFSSNSYSNPSPFGLGSLFGRRY